MVEAGRVDHDAGNLARVLQLGAPRRFSVAVLWLHSSVHLLAGVVLGLALGLVAARVLSSAVSRRTGLDLSAQAGVTEVLSVAGFPGLTAAVALVTALSVGTRRPASELR